jgi:hypothetical protein
VFYVVLLTPYFGFHLFNVPCHFKPALLFPCNQFSSLILRRPWGLIFLSLMHLFTWKVLSDLFEMALTIEPYLLERWHRQVSCWNLMIPVIWSVFVLHKSLCDMLERTIQHKEQQNIRDINIKIITAIIFTKSLQ